MSYSLTESEWIRNMYQNANNYPQVMLKLKSFNPTKPHSAVDIYHALLQHADE